ncbi:hypothetical protein [Streptomyces sp. Je 1-369]|uniref:hypothetical protein n=1 Tax=Streptomyces sp. Je 1-369 TaxID=2966192 RepID=UPI002285DF29|nr:hypothetical protein [Streptomyces sp. Je 1-369]WAL95833.1 hypothetical protein NOO62_15825 [Streptomyces sp. Je 1-369]
MDTPSWRHRAADRVESRPPHEASAAPPGRQHPMKALLWLVLAAAVVVNVSTGFALDGVQQVLVSVATGATALGAGAFLVLTHRRRA